VFEKNQFIDLLQREKKRRKRKPSDLVFIGAHNVAQHWWCSMYAVLKSRANELQFFSAYLKDRIEYSLKLGRICEPPKRDADILAVGDDLTVEQVERFHPQTLGSIESLRGSNPPSYQWWFPWDRYVIGGRPDGLARDTVLERKFAKNDYFAKTVARPVARTQADIYGVFFKRANKVVEIQVAQEERILNIEEPVNQKRAFETMRKFLSIDSGSPPIPPKAEKCRNCEFNESCAISQA